VTDSTEAIHKKINFLDLVHLYLQYFLIRQLFYRFLERWQVLHAIMRVSLRGHGVCFMPDNGLGNSAIDTRNAQVGNETVTKTVHCLLVRLQSQRSQILFIEPAAQITAPLLVIGKNMSSKGFTPDQIKTVIEAHKGYIYRAAKSAEAGDAKAQENLGDAYQDGFGLKQDYAEAAKWYAKAAEQENASAQYKLSLLYAYGHGVPVDYTHAAVLMKKAGENGHAKAKAQYESLLSEATAKYGRE
jgi:hypothetical protein